MQVAAGVVYAIALAQGVEVVALPRVTLAGHPQGVEHAAVVVDLGALLLAEQGEFVIDEADVERCVMDDQLGAVDELEEFVGDLTEARLVLEELVGDAVHRDGALVHFPIRLQVDVEVPAGKATPIQLDAANLDDPVTVGDRHAGGFGIQDYRSVT
ncbi:hypothetical protein D9M71_446340 [compost metagenome]